MERYTSSKYTSSRKPQTSMADHLTWSENPSHYSSSLDLSTLGSRPSVRSQQPAGGTSTMQFGGQTMEEAENLLKTKPCSGLKLRDITGSDIFAANGQNGAPESASAITTPNSKTGLRIYQLAVSAMSQISFSGEESVSPKKPTTVAEVAKQRELSGTIESETEAKKKQLSDLKSKELCGHDIFGGPPEITPRTLAARSKGLKESVDMGEPAPRNLRTSVKVSNPAGGHSNIMFTEEPVVKSAKKIHSQKFAELASNGIFKGNAPLGSAEKPLSAAKLREMNGSDIFADGKAPSRDYLRGARKPPGGESSISLV